MKKRFVSFLLSAVMLLGVAGPLQWGVALAAAGKEPVSAGERLGTVFARSEEAAAEAAELLRDCYEIVPEKVTRAPFVKGVVK